MNKKNDHTPKLILNVNEVLIARTMSDPPRTFVIASGEARTNATSPRLVRCEQPSIPETLGLDFEADDGHSHVITPVTAMFELKGTHGHNAVTVHAASNSITQEVPSNPSTIDASTVPDYTIRQHKDTFCDVPTGNVNNGKKIKFTKHIGRTGYATITAQAGLFAAGEVSIAEDDIETVYANPATPTDYTFTCRKEKSGPGGVGDMTGTIRVGTGNPGDDDR
jgi:hypothetical protein